MRAARLALLAHVARLHRQRRAEARDGFLLANGLALLGVGIKRTAPLRAQLLRVGGGEIEFDGQVLLDGMRRTFFALTAARRIGVISRRLVFDRGIDPLIHRGRFWHDVNRLGPGGRRDVGFIFAASEVAERHFDRRPGRIGIGDLDVERLFFGDFIANL
jgi:hypothetical protein